MSRRIHRVAGVIGFLVILLFWTSTVVVELVGTTGAVVAVKEAIPWGLFVLIPALAVTGATGFRMGGRSTDARIVRKKHRMPIIAGIGLLVLVPAALYLSAAVSRDLGPTFYLVQAVELLAGATNLTLMSLNIRDGLRLTGRLKARQVSV